MNFGLLGFACDEGVRRNNGRVGAAEGPQAFRKALQKINWHTQKNPPFTDFGDILCHEQDLESAQQELTSKVFMILQNHLTPAVIGGGHEMAFGHFLGISQFLGEKNLGIINFDAHFDLRPLKENKLGTSGTSFLQIAQERQAKKLAFDYGSSPFVVGKFI